MPDAVSLELEKETRVEKLKSATSELAEFLLHADPIVKRVGIAGSLARGKNPRDIDLIIFSDEMTASRDVLDEEGKHFFEYLSLNTEQEGELFELLIGLAFLGCEVDVTFLPDNPSKEFINFFTGVSRDPNFLQNIVDDILIFDENSRKFNHCQAFDSGKMEIIRQSSFNNLKELVEKTGSLKIAS